VTRPFRELPQLGSLREQLGIARDDRLGGLGRLAGRSDEMVRFSSLFGRVALVLTPSLVHEVLVARARSFEKSPVVRGALYPLAGRGLFTSEGELWRRQRKLMAPLFHDAAVAAFADVMTTAAGRIAAAWSDGEVVDVAQATTRITMAVAGKALFDIDTSDEADAVSRELTTVLEWVGVLTGSFVMVAQARAAVMIERLAARLPARLRSPARRLGDRVRIPLKSTRAVSAAVASLHARVTRMIADRRAGANRPRDLLALLLRAHDDDEGSMTDQQVRDEVLTLFVAGHETTANALAWTLMLLAQHPAWYQRVRDEALALGRAPTSADLPKLPVTTRVFKEALRLYPPVYFMGRVAVAETEVGGVRIPPGTVVLVSPYALHRRPDIWPEPERFDPDRFAPAVEAERSKTAYLPFGAGPRVCIGAGFAMMEGPLVLATLLQRADFERVADGEVAPDPAATLRPGHGAALRVRLRV
jgi:cytochrome P450